MKFTLLMLFAFLLCPVCYALESIEKEGFLVEVDFQYKNQKISLSKTYTQTIEKGLHSWIPISGNSKGVTLLGKMYEHSQGVVKWEFIVLDQTQTVPLVSNPRIIVREGHRASISMTTEQGASAEISIQVSPATDKKHPTASLEEVVKEMKKK
ncbi:MAG: hypothetical protein AB7F59_06095 [Bdellovibrionales bacterium]